MQTVASRVSTKRVAAVPAARVSSVRPLRVVCKAQSTNVSEVAKKAAAFAAGLPALVAASPAFALVDERMNGDGVGLPFGVNEGVLGWAIFGALGAVWALWFQGQKDLGEYDDEDSGLKL